jgi:hypothetical protein
MVARILKFLEAIPGEMRGMSNIVEVLFRYASPACQGQILRFAQQHTTAEFLNQLVYGNAYTSNIHLLRTGDLPIGDGVIDFYSLTSLQFSQTIEICISRGIPVDIWNSRESIYQSKNPIAPPYVKIHLHWNVDTINGVIPGLLTLGVPVEDILSVIPAKFQVIHQAHKEFARAGLNFPYEFYEKRHLAAGIWLGKASGLPKQKEQYTWKYFVSEALKCRNIKYYRWLMSIHETTWAVSSRSQDAYVYASAIISCDPRFIMACEQAGLALNQTQLSRVVSTCPDPRIIEAYSA